MAQFFIARPIFAWVIALFILVFGGVALTSLPVAQYPTVAPPSIVVTATYPGASAEALQSSVISVIEQEFNGSPGMIYMESVAQANGQGQITVTFEPETDPDLAQVDLQNRLARATPRLPAAVTQQGVRVDKARSNFLLFVTLVSTDGKLDPIALGDYASRNVLPEIQRLNGVGQAQLFGTERAMRIWLDPAKLVGYSLSASDVTNAIRQQNAQVSSGSVGEVPGVPGQQVFSTVLVRGQMGSVDEFGNIVLRARTDGSAVRLRDVARIELGGDSYARSTRLNGSPSTGIGVQLSPTGNALETADAIRKRMDELKAYLPAGVTYAVPYDTSRFVRISIQQVFKTLGEAVLLVFLVMYLFLQSFRYTLIPTIVVPIALAGTFAVMLAAGFSINVLTMFGLVLAIGILVDDAIVVVENVERIMAEEGLGPVEATRKAMSQITGAIIGITTVLVAVFIPMAFFGGAVGNIYRQFSLAMVVSMLFSAFLALSLTPALCATLLKPATQEHQERRGFFGWFNRRFVVTADRYQSQVAGLLKRPVRVMGVFAMLLVLVGWLYARLPTAFLPDEDQGYLLVNIQLPPGATRERTLEVMKQVEQHFMAQPEVENAISVLGFSFAGAGQNAALAFISLKDWSERSAPGQSSQAVARRAQKELAAVRDANILPLNPPPIRELGNATGFALRLQDRAGLGHAALLAARNQLLAEAGKSPLLSRVRPDGLEDAPQLRLEIDRDKAAALGVGFDAVNALLSTALGSSYVNDFPNQGRLQRVIVQADAPHRMQPEDVLRLNVLNNQGQPVPLAGFVKTSWVVGQIQAVRYNGYPALRIAGEAAAGYSTGDALAEVERLAGALPSGIGIEWTGQSREEKLSGATATILLAFSMLAVFLCLAALYESWTIPLAVMLVVPLGVLGSVLGVTLRELPNDVYFKVGLITIIGLSAKNAILIIEFARELQARGQSAVEATLAACRLRFRPIIMTSAAFILGVLPLLVASGAGSASQRAIGTGVVGGMLAATALAVYFVPLFYVIVDRIFSRSPGSGAGSPPSKPDPA